jgi:hypothetical protein
VVAGGSGGSARLLAAVARQSPKDEVALRVPIVEEVGRRPVAANELLARPQVDSLARSEAMALGVVLARNLVAGDPGLLARASLAADWPGRSWSLIAGSSVLSCGSSLVARRRRPSRPEPDRLGAAVRYHRSNGRSPTADRSTASDIMLTSTRRHAAAHSDRTIRRPNRR